VFVLRRLLLARDEPSHPDAYPGAKPFADDLGLIRESLGDNRGELLTRMFIDPLVRQAATFGFHLHMLDIREHAEVHQQAVAELSRGSEIAGDRAVLPARPSAQTGALLDALRKIADLKRTRPEAIRSYVISGVTSCGDVMSLIWLAESCGVRMAASPK